MNAIRTLYNIVEPACRGVFWGFAGTFPAQNQEIQPKIIAIALTAFSFNGFPVSYKVRGLCLVSYGLAFYASKKWSEKSHNRLALSFYHNQAQYLAIINMASSALEFYKGQRIAPVSKFAVSLYSMIEDKFNKTTNDWISSGIMVAVVACIAMNALKYAYIGYKCYRQLNGYAQMGIGAGTGMAITLATVIILKNKFGSEPPPRSPYREGQYMNYPSRR